MWYLLSSVFLTIYALFRAKTRVTTVDIVIIPETLEKVNMSGGRFETIWVKIGYFLGTFSNHYRKEIKFILTTTLYCGIINT